MTEALANSTANSVPAAEAYFETPRGKLALWTGVLGGAVAWAAQFQFGYALVRFSCTRGWPTGLHHAQTLVFLLGALASMLLALREWNRLRPAQSQEPGVLGRSRFLAGLGVITSAFFSLVIVAEWVPMFFLSPCWY
jgi:hypothetical protein